MSKAKAALETSITDAVHLLAHFDGLQKPPPENAEVLNRAGLVMAEWQHVDCAKARTTLDDLLAKRGDALHRSKPPSANSPPAPHLVKREELERAIRFLKRLVEATDKALVEE